MNNVRVAALVVGMDADQVFDRVSDFASYRDYTPAVQDIKVDRTDGSTCSSTWWVHFREGVIRWSEVDTIDRERLRIDFEQTEGDFAHFSGSWEVRSVEEGTELLFDSVFDLGMPSLAAILDPVAVNALTESIREIVTGLMGGAVTFRPSPAGVAG
ncbi:type II toxin-antitoxin system RatA family toxin [Streptomyces huiliensis]|uniref:type II toxin-antitoxin system RatA family toxin n=1 Tax=Streptomyces huiliensis TaxID=2876027 RepID=UPI001CBBF36B|nr:SRPBCC family protein [Streptomyces huiliensis]MBZ4323787.1 SRPBCC family protein [Streptomyces huiliensis]